MIPVLAEQQNKEGTRTTVQQQLSKLLEGDRRQMVYESKEFSDLFLTKVMEKGLPKIITVDVFDTFLLRGNESEIKRFWEIAIRQAEFLNSQGYTLFDEYDLLAARLSATKVSYRSSPLIQGCREGSALDIYRIMTTACLKIPAEYQNALLNIELNHELASLRLNTGLVSLLQILAERGCELVLLSDMYLHQEHIQFLILEKYPQWSELISEIISSADTTVSKASGKLFDLLQEQKSWSFESWVHMGDAEKGDVYRPEQKGINAINLPVSKATLEKRRECEEKTRCELRPRGLDHKMFNA